MLWYLFLFNSKYTRLHLCTTICDLFADCIWVKLLRRESQVPGAYQDFVQEVGTPNELLSDNSKVQAGEKFKKINRDNLTAHNFSTPYCQNQNPAERKIQDVKHRGILVLFESNAPLVFWCYQFHINASSIITSPDSNLLVTTPTMADS